MKTNSEETLQKIVGLEDDRLSFLKWTLFGEHVSFQGCVAKTSGAFPGLPSEKNRNNLQLRIMHPTVMEENPTPLEVGSLSHYWHGFYTSQVVQDFFHQQYPANLHIIIP